jgi:hypothetical protein
MKQLLLAACIFFAGNSMAQNQVREINTLTPDLNGAEMAPNIHSKPINESKVLWDVQMSADVATAIGSNGQAGIAYVNGEIWTSKWASDTLIRFSSTGTFIAKFTVPGLSGTRSMTTDGLNVFIGNNTNTIYILNPATYTISGTISSAAGVTSRFLTFDPNLDGGSGGFWTGNFNTDIVAISMTGAVLSVIPAATHTLTGMYGAAVDNVNPGGPYLWVYHQAGANNCQLTVLNLTTGTPTIYTHDVFTEMSTLFAATSNLAGGAFFSSTYIPGEVSIMTLSQGTPANAVIIYDAELSVSVTDVAATSLRPTRGYTKIPVTQIFGETFVAGYQNLSTSSLPEVNGELNIFYNSSLISTENFQATNVASGGTGTFTSNVFPMTNGVGVYEVTWTVTPDAGSTDSNPANDVYSFTFEVTDSVFARDNDIPTGTGYTVSSVDSAYAVVLYEVNSTDIVSGIWIQLETPATGDSTFGLIFNYSGSVGTEIARGNLQIIDANQNVYYLVFPGGVILNPGTYAFGVYEGVGVGIGLSQSTELFTPNVNFFNVGGTWTASGIQTSRFIRPVFGTPFANVKENTAENNLRVYPNPTSDKLSISFEQALSEAGDLTVVDLNGRVVLQQTLNAGAQHLTMHVNTLQAGTYLLHVQSGSMSSVRTISVQ